MSTFEFARTSLTPTEDDERISDLIETINDEFDGDLEHSKTTALLNIQRALWDKQEALRRDLESGTISNERYLSDLNHALKLSMLESESVLGATDFQRLFGDAGYAPDDLIDRDTFLKEREKNK